MYDKTGEGWLKHFLYGTSQLLELRGPQAHLKGAGRRFFLTVRIFEVSRALIYESETFLAAPEWKNMMEHMWTGAYTSDWHPKEALYDLMIRCADLGVRAMMLVITIAELGLETQKSQLQCIAAEGFQLRRSLQEWKKSAIMVSLLDFLLYRYGLDLDQMT